MTFKIDLEITEANSKKISFGPRSLGDIGQDILAIKVALGLLLPYDHQGNVITNLEADLQFPLDSNTWFDCSNGEGIDILRASTFDIRLQNAIIDFQTNNMFLIILYLFERFAVQDITTNGGENFETTEQFEFYNQIINENYYRLQAIFDIEYASIGEATLAILHGWGPSTQFKNKGYSHNESVYQSSGKVLSILPIAFYNDLKESKFRKSPDTLKAEGTIIEILDELDFLGYQEYLSSASSFHNWLRVTADDSIGADQDVTVTFNYPLEYGVVAFPTKINRKSLLYKSAAQIINQSDIEESIVLPGPERASNIRKFLEPDPFSDPDPFIISEDEIGYFFETDFLLNSEGPLPQTDQQTIHSIEDAALAKVLKFYKKPDIWNFLNLSGPENNQVKQVYFNFNDLPRPVHNGLYPINQLSFQEERINKSTVFKRIKDLITNEENEINRLKTLREPRENYDYPPRPGYTSNSWVEYIDQKITEKKNNINTHKQRRQDILANKEANFFIVTTEEILEGISSANAVSWRNFEPSVTPPLIKFVEYRTPSLRPDQSYRAYLIINKKKLDLIEFGDSKYQQSTTQVDAPAAAELPEVCYNQSSDQVGQTYEEYRSYALKKRREFTRAVKSAYEQGETNRSQESVINANNPGRIDLGQLGPFDMDNAFSAMYGLSNITSDREYTRKIISTLVEGTSDVLQKFGITDSDAKNLQDIIDQANISGGDATDKDRTSAKNNSLVISLEELKERVTTIVSDIQRAGQVMSRESIELETGSNFSAGNESQFLNRFYTQLIEYLESSLQNNAKLKAEWTKLEAGDTIASSSPSKVILHLRFKKVEGPPTASGRKLGPKFGKLPLSLRLGVDQGILPGSLLAAGESKSIKWLARDLINEPVIEYSQFDAITRPRTVNYISQIVNMTSPFSGSRISGQGVKVPNAIASFIDDSLNICAELGIDAEKHSVISLVGTFTSGIAVKIPDEEGFSEAYKDWTSKHFVNPAKEFWSTSQKNYEDSKDDTFDDDAALRYLGKLCTLESLYEEFIDKLDLSTLLCNYLECIKLPGFSLKLPNLYLPPFPRIPIIGWYDGLMQFLQDQIIAILTRILCSFARTIIDKLAFPFCEEQLNDFIAAGSSTGIPLMNQALAEALTNTGVTNIRNSQSSAQQSKQFFEDVTKVVTGPELCYLLQGSQLDDAAMIMVQKLAEKNGLSEDLDTAEAAANFFGVIGAYVPLEICNQLSQIDRQLSAATSCDDVADEMRSIRNRLQNSDNTVTEAEIQKALDIASKNIENQKASLEAFSGAGLDSILPENLKPGPQNIINSDVLGPMRDGINLSIQNIFTSTRLSYMSALSSFVPSLYLNRPHSVRPGDGNYNDISKLKIESALEQLNNFAMALERRKILENRDLDGDNVLRAQTEYLEYDSPLITTPIVTPAEVAELYTVFETENVIALDGTVQIVHKRYYPGKLHGIFDAANNDELVVRLGYEDPTNITQQEYFDYMEPNPAADNNEFSLQSVIRAQQPGADFQEQRDSNGHNLYTSAISAGSYLQESKVFFLKPLELEIVDNLRPLNPQIEPSLRYTVPKVIVELQSLLTRVEGDNIEVIIPQTKDEFNIANDTSYESIKILKKYFNSKLGNTELDPRGDESPAPNRILSLGAPYIGGANGAPGNTDIIAAKRATQEVLSLIFLEDNGSGTVKITTDNENKYHSNEYDQDNFNSRVANIIPDYEIFLRNNNRLLRIARERVEELTSKIVEEIPSLSQNSLEQYLPLINEVFEKMSRSLSDKNGDINYRNVQRSFPGESSNWYLMAPMEVINLNFRANPYTPSIKMVDIATQKDNLDSYNIVIDQDFFLRQPSANTQESQGDRSLTFETPNTLNGPDTVTRKIFKFCDILEDRLIQNNIPNEPNVIEGKDYAKRESYAQFLTGLLRSGGIGIDDTLTREFIKTFAFKSTVEQIFQELIKSIEHGSFFNREYAEALHERIAAQPYVIPGTKCLVNRYGLTENSLLSFKKVLLEDAADLVAQEMRKPEFSPYNRSFGQLGPFESAMKKISLKVFVRACLVDFLFKSGMSLSVWSLEAIVDQPLTEKYIFEHVKVELKRNRNFRNIWGKIVEDLEPATNRDESLKKYVKKQFMSLTSVVRRLYLPGLGKKDFFNWHTYGRTAPRQTNRSTNAPEYGVKWLNTEGVFKRLSVPVTKERSEVPFPGHNPGSEGQIVCWKAEPHEGSTSRFNRSQIFPLFRKNKVTLGSGEAGSDPALSREMVNEFIYEDYVRLEGEILEPVLRRELDLGEDTPVERYHPPFEGGNRNTDPRWNPETDTNRSLYSQTMAIGIGRNPDRATPRPIGIVDFAKTLCAFDDCREAFERYRPDSRRPLRNLYPMPEMISSGDGSKIISFSGIHEELGLGEMRAIAEGYNPMPNNGDLVKFAAGVLLYGQRVKIYCEIFGVNWRRILPNDTLPFDPNSEQLSTVFESAFQAIAPFMVNDWGNQPLFYTYSDNGMTSSIQSSYGSEVQGNLVQTIENTLGREERAHAAGQGFNDIDVDLFMIPQYITGLLMFPNPHHENEYDSLTPVGGNITEVGLESRYNSVVISMKEFDNLIQDINAYFDVAVAQGVELESRRRDIFENSRFYHGLRLTQLFLDSEPTTNRLIQSCLLGQGNFEAMQSGRERERSYLYTAPVEQGSCSGVAIPIVSYERPLTMDSCPEVFTGGLYQPDAPGFLEMMRDMEVKLSKTQAYKDFMNVYFPMRRFMSIATLSSNSSLAGFGDMPTLFDSVKSLSSFVAIVGNMPANQRAINGDYLISTSIDQIDFQKQVSENFPGDPDDAKCLEFPTLTKDFWDNFYKELKRLAKYFPSILFRGLANNLDPAYKEMRAHFLNCDIKDLDWRGLGVSRPTTRLVNGLDPRGKAQGTQSGKYNSIISQLPVDFAISMFPFINPWQLTSTVSKTLAYAFTGFLPFIDLSSVFKVPCKEIDENWLPEAKYDIGFKGRYGHPISPLTAFALSTLSLPADRNKRNSNCQDTSVGVEATENECEDISEELQDYLREDIED